MGALRAIGDLTRGRTHKSADRHAALVSFSLQQTIRFSVAVHLTPLHIFMAAGRYFHMSECHSYILQLSPF